MFDNAICVECLCNESTGPTASIKAGNFTANHYRNQGHKHASYQ